LSTLRVLLSQPADPETPAPWARYDDAGRIEQRGVDPRTRWPAAARREAVLAGDAVRLVALRLPPMAESRRRAAAMFALEDQLAGPADAHAVLLSPAESDGRAVARIVDRGWLQRLVRGPDAFARVIAEPDLAPARDAWRWCGRAAGGFVRRVDGSSFGVGPVGDDGGIPAELALALAHAARSGASPAAIDVEVACDGAACAAWSQRHGIAFRPREPWTWERSNAFAQAPDLGASLAPAAPSRSTPARDAVVAFRPAIAIVLVAVALHAVATAGTWVARRIELARVQRAIADVAAGAGVRDAAGGDALAALGREHARQRHAAGLVAAGDAVPLLARIAPPLATLPDAALRSATYAAGAWTLELAAIDDAAVSRLVRAIGDADVPVAHARNAGGVRVRVGPVP